MTLLRLKLNTFGRKLGAFLRHCLEKMTQIGGNSCFGAANSSLKEEK
jgi:hypothetical protein